MQSNEEKEEWNTEKNIKKVLGRLNDLVLQANLSVPFLKAAVMKMKAMLTTTLVTLRQTRAVFITHSNI